MEYDNETIPDVIGGAAGDASPAILYGPRFTLQRISQVKLTQPKGCGVATQPLVIT